MTTTTVRVPASSANLGPGFDCFAAALDLWLELRVSDSDRFAVATDLPLPLDRTNLVVRAFEQVHPSEGLRFEIDGEIPLSGGLGSSAAAVVAGLLAAAHRAGTEADILSLATGVEGHADNAAAALHGGVVVVSHGHAHRFTAPANIAAVLVVPHEGVRTADARAALPAQVPLADAADNVAHGALLVLGLKDADPALVSRGLRDHLHQPYRAKLYPRSAELRARARELGALGATISGAGPTILFWVTPDQQASVAQQLTELTKGWAKVIATSFSQAGAQVIQPPTAQPPQR